MRRFLTTPIRLPWLAGIAVVSTLLFILAVEMDGRVRSADAAARYEILGFLSGPWCLLMAWVLIASFYRSQKRNLVTFGIGIVPSAGTFIVWYHMLARNFSHGRLELFLTELLILLGGGFLAHLTFGRRGQDEK